MTIGILPRSPVQSRFVPSVPAENSRQPRPSTMSQRTQQAREALLTHSETLRAKAEDATNSLSEALQSQGMPPQAARTGAYLALASLVFLAPLIATAIALAVCWLCISVSMVVAALACCLAVGTALLVLAFIGLACMAGAAFAVTLIVTLVIGSGIVMAAVVTVTGLIGTKLFARVGGQLFTRLDRFITTMLSQQASETTRSDRTYVSTKIGNRTEQPSDTVLEPVNHKLPLKSGHEA